MIPIQSLEADTVIGLVDPIRTACALVDEVLARGLPCIIIGSGCVAPLPPREGCRTIAYQGDMAQLVRELKGLGVTQIIAGCDPVILFTDRLSAAMEVPSNGLRLSEARRDKGKMGAAVRQAGLRTPAEIQASSFAEIAAWLERVPMPVVIKPSTSGGTDDVYKCETISEVEHRFVSIIGKINLMGSKNHAVVVQEFIDGIEFVVDSVSFDGVHVFTDVLQYEKGTHNGRAFIYEKMRFLPADDVRSQRLTDFARKALDALDFKVGAAHMELKINARDEVVFLEVGARLAGASIHTLVLNGRGDGTSQVQLMIDAVSGKDAPLSPYPARNVAVKVFIVTDKEGRVKGFKNLEKIKALRSFRGLDLHVHVGDEIQRTTDLAHSVGMVDLAHTDPTVLEQDEATLKGLLAEGLFLLNTPLKGDPMFFDPTGKDDRTCIKEMVHGYNISCAIFTAVKLGIAECLEDGPKGFDDLAALLEVDADALNRVMRLLVNAGVLVNDSEGRFALAPRGEYLRRSHPASIASEVLLFAGEETYLAWSQLLHSVRTGAPAFNKYFGKPIFEYLDDNRSSSNRFHSGWKEITTQVGRELATQVDVSNSGLVMDIGGGSGVLVAAVLKQHPHLKGVVYDLPFSLETTQKTLEDYQVSDRCIVVPGDAMKAVPKGADLQILKSVLHNCPDTDAVRILRSSAAALNPGGKILVLERVIQDEGAYVWGNVVDVAMLVMTGGRERTLEHYGRLYAQAGLRLTRCVTLASGFSIIEGELAN